MADKVVLVKRRGKLIGLSSSYDYTHRPLKLQNYTLYDWVRSFNRISTRSKNYSVTDDENDENDEDRQEENTSINKDTHVDNPLKLKPNELKFLKGHPLASTHRLSLRRNHSNTVPNFLGGPLPRPDKEDREYYCCTMLTIFKPWRTGKDLKTENESWHEAFENYAFSEQAKNHIKNLNLRYECLDSRDDFRAQLKAGNVTQ
ncbi:hypothetical protein F5877DRAFT_45411, partial [Lentinula edodes]